MAPTLGTKKRRIFEFLAFQRQLSILIYTAFVSRQSSSRLKKNTCANLHAPLQFPYKFT